MFKKGGKSKKQKGEQEKEPGRILQLKELSDMLLAGGYFRARIPTLSPFDKVVGGLVWAISASGVSVDVDLIFQENSSIGERIKLSEGIVTALLKMKCPYPIQPNQIQGLDYDNIFPVVRWLIKSVLENRRLTGDRVRQLAVSQFGRSYTMVGAQDHRGQAYVTSVHHKFRPTRKFRKASNANFKTREQHVEASLLEYGEKISRYVEDTEGEEKAAEKKARRGKEQSEEDKQRASEIRQRKAEAKEQERLEELQQQLAEAGVEGKVSSKAVGNVMTMQAAEIQAMAANFIEEQKHQEEQAAEAGSENSEKKMLAMQFQRQMDNFEKKVKAKKVVVKEKKTNYKANAAKVAEVQDTLDNKNAYKAKILEATGKLDEAEKNITPEQKSILHKLKAMVQLNENLKAQEKKFVENCKVQREELLRKLTELEEGAEDADMETKRMLEIEKLHRADEDKLARITKALAKKNQEVSVIQRQIDEMPTRAELLQFERRFVELYDLVGAKLIETRKYYQMYNTLDESHGYMRQECDLLNSIIDGFPVAARSKNGRAQYQAQVAGILEGIQKTQDHVAGEYEREVTTRDMVVQKHTLLVERQRAYFKAVKEFQEECNTNEKLVTGLEGLQKKIKMMQARQQQAA